MPAFQSGLAKWTLRGTAFVVSALAFFSYDLLAARLTETQAQSVVFHAALLVGLGAAVGVLMNSARWTAALREVAIGMPVWAALLGLNVFIGTVLVLNIFTQWGLIALLLTGGALILFGSLKTEEQLKSKLREAVKASALSFGVVYSLLFGGEIFLRANPMLVGGGGGGNPALEHLYEGLYETNFYGLREEEFSRSPADATFRILSLGDSFTFGQGVERERTYPHLLEERLNTVHGSPRFEVINAGQRGLDLHGELDYLRDEGLSLEPDLVTVQFYENDLVAPREETAATANRLLNQFVKRPLRESYVVFFLQYRFDQALRQLRSLAEGDEQQHSAAESTRGNGENERAWSALESSLDGLKTVSDHREIPVLLILFPHPLKSESEIGPLHDSVSSLAQEIGLPVLDLAGSLDSLERESRIVSSIDHHPGPAAHRVAAERVHRRLLDLGMLPGATNR